MAKIRKTDNAIVGEDVEQQELSYTAGGSEYEYNHFGKLAESIKAEHMHTLRPNTSTFRSIPKREK